MDTFGKLDPLVEAYMLAHQMERRGLCICIKLYGQAWGLGSESVQLDQMLFAPSVSSLLHRVQGAHSSDAAVGVRASMHSLVQKHVS